LCVGDGPFACGDGCDPGTVSCGTSCVSTSTNPRHCGACMRVCPAPANAASDCVDASCTFRCDDGFYDCDLAADNGCESRHRELGNCGACGTACAFPSAITSCS